MNVNKEKNIIQYSKLKASVVAGLMEVLTTHPIDYIKTLSQDGQPTKRILSQLIKNPYTGIQSRLIGIIPMRILFWNTIDYFQRNNYSALSTGVLTASIQTLIDYPIEQIKIQCMVNKKCIKDALLAVNRFSFTTHLSRNILFASVFSIVIDNNPDSYYLAALGGFVGAIISHPLDTLKTWYQIGNTKYPKYWLLKDYFRGWHHRGLISLVSMNIGWIIFRKMNNYNEK